jgi:hypothetical protein
MVACPICLLEVKDAARHGRADATHFICVRCGEYDATGIFVAAMRNERPEVDWRWQLSSAVRTATDFNKQLDEMINTDTYLPIIDRAPRPMDKLAQADQLVVHIDERTPSVGAKTIPESIWAWVARSWMSNWKSLDLLGLELKNRGLLEGHMSRIPGDGRDFGLEFWFQITLDGARHARGVRDARGPKPPASVATLRRTFGDRWEVVEDKGDEGGQGHVYKVRNTLSGSDGVYALKTILKQDDPKAIARFKREMTVMAGLVHPNIVKIHASESDIDPPYYVMDYYEGGTLERRIPGISGNPTLALQIFRQVCVGVAVAHRLGIVHRDLKPPNVLLTADDVPAVSDFGVCFTPTGDRLTSVEEKVGPRYYMAPELAHGAADDKVITPRCDVYSLGKILYRLLSPGHMFDREVFDEPRWDLVVQTKNDAMTHVNVLLSKTVVYDAAGRLPDATAVLAEVDRIIPLVKGSYRLISKTGGQLCTFCGEGHYQLIVDGDPSGRGKSYASVFEVGNYTGHDWRVLSCTACGHLQYFRLDKSHGAKERWST